MKNTIGKWLAALFLGLMSSCSDYLDLVPDNVATLDDAFETRNAAEKYLFTCFHYLPNMMEPAVNPAILGSDECWWNIEQADWWGGYENGKYLARGQQVATNPLFNFWDGGNGGTNLWIAINHCNTFLENIDKPYDLQPYEKEQWIAEVKFLKAYYHYFLFQLYGPIPIMDKNLPVSSTPEEVRVYRNTVDEVVDYICNLLDEAKQGLPLKIQQMATDAGRPTQTMCLALKAKVLALAASPLFNGNPDYEGYKDNRGINIFGDNVGTVDMKKWERAAKALKNAIDTCHLAENKLYKHIKVYEMSDTTVQKLSIRGSVTEKWNEEIIWGATVQNSMTLLCMPRFETINAGAGAQEFGMSLKSAETFYSNHGVPIDEDKTYDYEHRYETRVAKAPNEDEPFDHRYYIQEGETTANLHFYREPRFYASIGFDRGIYEGAGVTDDTKSLYLECHKGEPGGFMSSGEHTPTCFFNKKIINYESAFSNSNLTRKAYSFPLIRLADLYLLYAEVLNEIKAEPDEEVYYWIDLVRERAGLEGVVESWQKYSNNPTKPSTQYGMRQIIHHERNNEFMGEFMRYWDLRRWKEAVKEYNLTPVQGWNYQGETVEEFYNVQTIYNEREYSMKHYLWPISNTAILRNPNLVQNPGWAN